jgi:hypothetical protein
MCRPITFDQDWRRESSRRIPIHPPDCRIPGEPTRSRQPFDDHLSGHRRSIRSGNAIGTAMIGALAMQLTWPFSNSALTAILLKREIVARIARDRSPAA